jgi:hypothetical protein
MNLNLDEALDSSSTNGVADIEFTRRFMKRQTLISAAKKT